MMSNLNNTLLRKFFEEFCFRDFGPPPIPVKALCIANGGILDILLIALALQQSLSDDAEETYHQPIERSGLTLASRLQESVGQKETLKVSSEHHFPHYGTPHMARKWVDNPTVLEMSPLREDNRMDTATKEMATSPDRSLPIIGAQFAAEFIPENYFIPVQEVLD
ncbi:hypothetical protein TNCV_2270591 [Trichonephila clavipes]|nr:hypothetical protein TNCV_2270591 [Trichonephila clavipes]